MATTTFDNLITFSRGSNATVTGPNGLIQWAPANLLTNSESFEAAAWSKQDLTATANALSAPDGTTTADRILEAATNTLHQVYVAYNLFTVGATYTWSIYAKAEGRSWFWLEAHDGGNRKTWFNLVDGTVGTNAPGNTATITPVGNGWYRVSVSRIAGGANGYFAFGPANADGASIYPGDITRGVNVWGAQLELGSTATTYNNTSVRNLLGFSEALDNAAWTKTRASIVTGAQANPVNGLFNAQKLMEDTTTANHGTQQSVTLVAVPYVYSVYLKAAGRSWAQLVNGSVGNCFAYFDLANGAVGTVGAGATSAAITAVGSGWYRCSILFTAASGGNIIIARNASANGTTSYTGDGSSGVYIYGAMLSNSASLDPYVPTPGAAPSSTAYYGPRFDYDPVTLLPRGLLVEEARTNLLLRSEEFDNAAWTKNNSTVTANATTSPDGTVNADKLAETAVTSSFSAVQAPTLAFSTTYTFSCYMKAAERTFGVLNIFTGAASCWTWFNLSTGVVSTLGAGATATIAAVGNGWYRCTLTIATAASGSPNIAIFPAATNGALSYAGTAGSGIFIWGAQLEAGAFATSYIPTIASTVTRSADVATITGSLFSQWYNQNEGAFVVGVSYLNAANTAWVWAAHSGLVGSTNDYIAHVKNSAAINRQAIVAAGVSQGNLEFSGAAAGTVYQMAGAYRLNDAAFTVNGAAVGTDTTVTLPTPNALAIGNLFNQYLSGHIRSIRYVPVRAADFQLQQVTT